MSNPEFHQCCTCGYEWKHGQYGGHDCAATLNAHYEALREKCEEQRLQIERDTGCIDRIRDRAAQLEVQNEELQRIKNETAAEWQKELARANELQRELDEVAKQDHPVAWVRFRSDGGYEGPLMDSDSRMDAVRRTSGAWTKLYRHPPNLPALIEQARQEEREKIGNRIHYPKCWDTAAYPTLEDALAEIHFCSQCYDSHAEAARARKP